MDCSVATSPDSKSVVLKSLYYRFQIGIGRSTSCIGRWSTLENMSDLVQVGRKGFAGMCYGLLFEIDMSPAYADEAAKHVEPGNLSLCCNGTVDIGLCAKDVNLDSRWLTMFFMPTVPL